MEEGRSAFKILTAKPTGNRPLGRHRRRWEDNIRMRLKETDGMRGIGPLGRSRPRWEDNIRMDLVQIGINAGNWVNSAQDRNYLESPCKCGIEPPGSISHGAS